MTNNNNVPNLVLSVSACLLLLLLLFHGSLATQFQQQDTKCQLNRLEALEFDDEIAAQEGSIYTWNPNHDQFRCTGGAALVKYVINKKGFLLPSYSNAPQLLFLNEGYGIVGVMLPGGCQKFVRLRDANLFVIPAGVAFWIYSETQKFVAISLLHTGSQLNQLVDPIPKRFYLAGNPEDEFAPYRQQQQQQQQQQRSSANNVFGGFDTQRLADSLKLNVDTIRKLQGDSNDQRKNIVRMDGDLHLETTQINKGQHYSNQGSSQRHERGDDDDDDDDDDANDNGNGSIDDDMYSCSVRLKHNVLYRRHYSTYTPRGGYIFTANSSNFPILKHLRLAFELSAVHTGSSYVPHWSTNAHSVMYALTEHAQVQVVNDQGESVFDGEFRAGQALVVPQNYAAVINSNSNKQFWWLAFKTNDQNELITLAGPQSFIRTLPEGVLQNVYNLSRVQIENIVKQNRIEST